jgi:Uma2 family endonuclease
MATFSRQVQPRRRDRLLRLTVDQYFRLNEVGFLGEKDPVSLWKGQLLVGLNKGPPYCNTVAALNALLVRIVPTDWHVRHENPLVLVDAEEGDSVPEPALMLVRGSIRDYCDRWPSARDVGLLVEVSDSSLAEDQTEALAVYAKHLIPVYWIINLPLRRVEVYADPTGPTDAPDYRTSRHFGPGDEVPVVVDGQEIGRIAVGDVLL